MKPHLAHIQNTLIKKELAERAKDPETSYKNYMRQVEAAKAIGWMDSEIIHELEGEISRIESDKQDVDDPIFQQGVHNAKVACISAIRLIISEIKGESK